MQMCPDESSAHRKRAEKRKKKVDRLIAIHSLAFSHLTQRVIIIIIMMQNYRTFALVLSFFVSIVRLPIFPAHAFRVSSADRDSRSQIGSILFVAQWCSLWAVGRAWGRYLNANRNIFQAFKTIASVFHLALGKLNLMDFNFSWCISTVHTDTPLSCYLWRLYYIHTLKCLWIWNASQTQYEHLWNSLASLNFR